jgi:ATP phosphoribosyltransferase regulatory subunit
MTYRWLLPEYIEDLLPEDAWRLEMTRRNLLDLFRRRGYELVMPPLLEYVDSLLTGTGRDMEPLTFKLVDQLSGRQLGLRADITPQAARIDAHGMNHQGVNRLCYAGSILHTRPEGLNLSREPFQVGAEIYGLDDLSGDIEIQELMLQSLKIAGLSDVVLDVGHVGLFRGLARLAALEAKAEAELFEALQHKDVPTLRDLTARLERPIREALRLLPQLNGERGVLAEARMRLPEEAGVQAALMQLERVADHFADRQALSFDLAELRGYHYHSGLVFAAYAEGYSDAVARGGRYDEVGRAFGRARAATGFSLDLRELLPSLPPG